MRRRETEAEGPKEEVTKKKKRKVMQVKERVESSEQNLFFFSRTPHKPSVSFHLRARDTFRTDAERAFLFYTAITDEHGKLSAQQQFS